MFRARNLQKKITVEKLSMHNAKLPEITEIHES